MVYSARVLCDTVRVGGNNLNNVWWNVLKTAVERKEAAWKEVLGARNKVVKERRIKAYKEEKRNLKVVFITSGCRWE